MKRLITIGDVCTYLKIAATPDVEPAIDTAHALVAAHLLVQSLDRAVRTEKHKPTWDTRLIVTRSGPIATFTSAKLNGVAISEDNYLSRFWTIENIGDEPWVRGDVLELEFTTGFGKLESSAGDDVYLPFNVKRALIITAAVLHKRNSTNVDPTVTSERIGDYSYTRSDRNSDEHGDIPQAAADLLLEYRKPRI
jgi:hypothetical protein